MAMSSRKISKAIDIGRDFTTGGIERSEQLLDEFAEELKHITPRVTIIMGFFQGGSRAIDASCDSIFNKLLQVTVDEALELQKITPKYSHIISDNKFNKAMAKSHVHHHENTEPLNQKTIKIYHLLTALGFWHGTWGSSHQCRRIPKPRRTLT